MIAAFVGTVAQAVASTSQGAGAGDVGKSAVLSLASAYAMQGLRNSILFREIDANIGDATGIQIKNVRDNVLLNPKAGLVADGNTLRGAGKYFCAGSTSLCDKAVPRAVRSLKNYRIGGYKLEYEFTRVDNLKDADLLIKESFGQNPAAQGAYEWIGKHNNVIKIPGVSLETFNRFQVNRIIRHEIGHWWGLGHQYDPASFMSYEKGAPKNFGKVDMKRLIDAY